MSDAELAFTVLKVIGMAFCVGFLLSWLMGHL